MSKKEELSDDMKQKIKDYLFDNSSDEVLIAIESRVSNPLSPSSNEKCNIIPWEVKIELIYGMVDPK